MLFTCALRFWTCCRLGKRVVEDKSGPNNYGTNADPHWYERHHVITQIFWWQGARCGLWSWQVDAGDAQSLLLMNAPPSSPEGHGVQSTDRHALTIDGVESADYVSGNDEIGQPALNPNPLWRGFGLRPNISNYFWWYSFFLFDKDQKGLFLYLLRHWWLNYVVFRGGEWANTELLIYNKFYISKFWRSLR